MVAAAVGNAVIVEILLRAGAKVNAKDAVTGVAAVNTCCRMMERAEPVV